MSVRGFLACLCIWIGTGMPAFAGTVSGTASNRHPVDLKEPSAMTVKLRVHSADGSGHVVSQQQIDVSALPAEFHLAFADDALRGSKRVTLEVEITSGGQLLFINMAEVEIDRKTPQQTLEVEVFPLFADLSSGRWRVTEILGAPLADGWTPEIAFSRSGAVEINAGCNTVSGMVDVTPGFSQAGQVAFPVDLSGTLMACGKDIELLERAFLGSLRDVVQYQQDGLDLVFYDKAEVAVVRLRFKRS